VYNKPHLNSDLGIFLQDTWTSKRLTITPGIRWDYLSNQIDPESAEAGRFVPARSFAAVTCDAYPGISCFKNWAPRLGLVYDLFGNHKTALKVGVGKYETPLAQGNLNAFNPMFIKSQSRSWSTLAAVPVRRASTTTRSVLLPARVLGPDAAVVRPHYHREATCSGGGVQHQIRNGLTFDLNWSDATTISRP
jgi:hypothetical protein